MTQSESTPVVSEASKGAVKPAPIRTPLKAFRNAAFYLATTFITNAFLLFESSIDVRVYGLERLQAVKRSGRSPLLVIWHGQGLMPMSIFRHERLCLYASHARDPNYARSLILLRWWTLRFIERLGYRVLDASEFKSESRGVLQFVDLLRNGTGSVIAADGPQGPIYQAKPGPTFLAKKSGVALVPLGAALSGGFQLDQWDRFEVPWPFARAVIVIGEPILVSSGAKEPELEAARLQLETEMNRLAAEAHARLHSSEQVSLTAPLQAMEQMKRDSAEGNQQTSD